MLINSDTKLNFDDVLITPKRSTLESRKDVQLVRVFNTRHGLSFSGIPIIASNMATGNFKMLEKLSEHQIFTAIAKHHQIEWEKRDLTDSDIQYGFYTLGISDDTELDRLEKFYNNKYKKLTDVPIKLMVDVPNGYLQRFSKFITTLRQKFADAIIFAGNVCTPEMTAELIIAGADGVKIGVGPGSFCRTRMMTGVGVPQVSAIIECADAAHGLNGLIIADGGCRLPGDIAKAFCANADMVMIGTMLAGTDECDGEIIVRYIKSKFYKKINSKSSSSMNKFEPIFEEKKYKIFYGMSSDKAQKAHFGGIREYRASEGREEEVEYIGSADSVVRNILGGLRSCGTYIGASNIKQFGKCATFIRTNKIH